MVVRRVSILFVGILLLFCFMSIKSFGSTFVDMCDSTSNTQDTIYEDFSYTSKSDELFVVESGLNGGCLYAESAADRPSILYGLVGAEEVKVTFISANSTSVFTDSQGNLALGKLAENYKYYSSNVFVTDDGIAFTNGLALGYDLGYKFENPMRCKKSEYLGVNVYVISESGKPILLERKLDNIRTVPKFGGGYVYVEDYYWKVPPNSGLVNVTINGCTKVFDGKNLRSYIQKKPHGISRVEISGERMVLLRNLEKDNNEDSNKNKDSGKKASNSKSGAGIVVDVESENHTDITENVTIYDNDSVVQNIYNSGGSKEVDSKKIDEDDIPISGVDEKDSVMEMVDNFQSSAQPKQDNTWKLAGAVYIAVSLVMLLAALIVKKPRE